MNELKFAKLAEVVEGLHPVLEKSGHERYRDMNDWLERDRDDSPDAGLSGTVRVLIVADVDCPLNDEAEYLLSTELDRAVGEALHKGSWKVVDQECWVHYLEGPSACIVM